MLVIRPFRGIIYNRDKVGDLSKVVAPPYDIISPSEQDFYYQIHPYNIIRIILGKDEATDRSGKNKYFRAASFFRDWLSRGILKREPTSSIYTYCQKYNVDDEEVERKGFIALMKLEQFSSGVVFPHEEVFSEPQEDRLNLLRACHANFSAIFTLFNGSGGKIDNLLEEEELVFEFEDFAGITHRLSAIRDQELINKICYSMQDKKVLIADGHHRYLTALRFREEMRRRASFSPGADYTMVYFLDMNSRGVTILPVHRLIGGLTLTQTQKLVKDIERFFYKKPFKKLAVDEKDEIVSKRLLSEVKKIGGCSFGIYTKKEGYFLLFPKDPQPFLKKVKSAILDELVKNLLNKKSLKKGKEIHFTTSTAEAIEEVKKGRFQVAFFLAPTTIQEVRDVALSGGKMPPKSTYFYPKLLSGLVMRDLEDAV